MPIMRPIKFYTKMAVHGSLAHSLRMVHPIGEPIPSLTVFTYHSFCTAKPIAGFSALPIGMFERQIGWLRRTHNLVSLSEGLARLADGSNRRAPMAAITIDDGFADNYQVAWPVLVRHKVPATIFIATDFVDTGRAPWPTSLWDIVQTLHHRHPSKHTWRRADPAALHYRQLQADLRHKDAYARRAVLRDFVLEYKLADLPTRPALNWDQIREMAASGIHFGSHTVDHGYLPSLPERECLRELVESKQRIEQQLQRECFHFAYPNGDWSEVTAVRVREAGYHAALTQDFGANTANQNPYALRRIEVPSHDPLASFRYRALRALPMSSTATTEAITRTT